MACNRFARIAPFESVNFMSVADADSIDWSSQPLLHRRADLAGATSTEAVFDATATALEFPDYFGRNWDALLDCLRDLDWLPPAGGYVLTAANARQLWQAAPAVAGLFTELWLTAAEDWAEGSRPWDPEIKSFHLIWAL